jgi:hypothetical protein
MRKVVADQLQRLRVVGHRVNGDRGIAFDLPLQIVMRAVDGGGYRLKKSSACRPAGGGGVSWFNPSSAGYYDMV